MSFLGSARPAMTSGAGLGGYFQLGTLKNIVRHDYSGFNILVEVYSCRGMVSQYDAVSMLSTVDYWGLWKFRDGGV